MPEETLRNNFTFHEKIDATYLFSLYGDDYVTIEEIFGTTLTHLGPDVEAVKQSFTANAPDELRKAVHKIKPTFGFVGLVEVQHLCKEMEDNCQKVTDTGSIAGAFQQLMTALEDARKIIETEYHKLKDYNSNSI